MKNSRRQIPINLEGLIFFNLSTRMASSTDNNSSGSVSPVVMKYKRRRFPEIPDECAGNYSPFKNSNAFFRRKERSLWPAMRIGMDRCLFALIVVAFFYMLVFAKSSLMNTLQDFKSERVLIQVIQQTVVERDDSVRINKMALESTQKMFEVRLHTQKMINYISN